MKTLCFLFVFGATATTCFLDHTQRRTTVGRTLLDEWSARRRDFYLTIHNTHNRQISMSLMGFEPTISAGERPQTYALDRAATGTSIWTLLEKVIKSKARNICLRLDGKCLSEFNLWCTTSDQLKETPLGDMQTNTYRSMFYTRKLFSSNIERRIDV